MATYNSWRGAVMASDLSNFIVKEDPYGELQLPVPPPPSTSQGSASRHPPPARKQHVSLPVSRVRTIMKTNVQSSQHSVNISQDSVLVLSRATVRDENPGYRLSCERAPGQASGRRALNSWAHVSSYDAHACPSPSSVTQELFISLLAKESGRTAREVNASSTDIMYNDLYTGVSLSTKFLVHLLI